MSGLRAALASGAAVLVIASVPQGDRAPTPAAAPSSARQPQQLPAAAHVRSPADMPAAAALPPRPAPAPDLQAAVRRHASERQGEAEQLPPGRPTWRGMAADEAAIALRAALASAPEAAAANPFAVLQNAGAPGR